MLKAVATLPPLAMAVTIDETIKTIGIETITTEEKAREEDRKSKAIQINFWILLPEEN